MGDFLLEPTLQRLLLRSCRGARVDGFLHGKAAVVFVDGASFEVRS